MAKRPTLKTKRLILRPHTLDDAQAVHRLLQERDIADTAYNLPYPYLKGMAEEWIGSRQESFDKGEGVEFAITNRQEGYLIGGIGLKLDKANARAELGYWIGKPYWNQGYCTEAARAVVKYGFEVLKLNRIHANHITRNPASGRVMQKIGMKHEGTRRQHIKRWGKFEDSEVYGILRSEYLAQKA
jgi:RimJ/RimL family protein N-acetyltransferase